MASIFSPITSKLPFVQFRQNIIKTIIYFSFNIFVQRKNLAAKMYIGDVRV